MFAVIETNGANNIIINIPKEGADRSLPALAAMLENNATFISADWRGIDIKTPRMTVMLGDTFSMEPGQDVPVLKIAASPDVIDDSFVIASPQALVSAKEALAKKTAEITRLATELTFTKQQLAAANERIEAMFAAQRGDE